jgi:hypothetical protein
MDLKTYFELFWIPAVASAALMALLWIRGRISAPPMFLTTWFLLAFAAQYFRTTTSVWVAGLALQTALAIVLLLKHQLGQL